MKPSAPTQAGRAGRTILVVDDEAPILPLHPADCDDRDDRQGHRSVQILPTGGPDHHPGVDPFDYRGGGSKSLF